MRCLGVGEVPVKHEVSEPACVLGKLLNLVKLKGVLKPQGDGSFPYTSA